MRRIGALAVLLAFAAVGCATEGTYEESGYSEPAYEEPAYSEPAYEEPAYESPFEETYDPSIGDPEVTIVNNTDVAITVTLSGPAYQTVEVAPYGNQTIVVPAGTYSFTGSAYGVLPTSGSDTFGSAYRYTWTFVIVETPQ